MIGPFDVPVPFAGVPDTAGVLVCTGVTVAAGVGSTCFPEIAKSEKPGEAAS
jgi:hypothetical protein